MVKKTASEETKTEIPEALEARVEKSIIDKRKKKFIELFLNKGWIFIIGLIIIVLITVNVRTSNIPYLKDTTTGNYTLAPDLDPFLFLRWAKYIAEHGKLMYHDTMRYSPLGYYPEHEATLTSYLIAYLYKSLHIFYPNITVEFVAIIYPVIFFSLATIFFFLFVRRLFAAGSTLKKNVIALLATLFFVFMPSLLHRTTAGVPEKEAAGIFFLFLALYLFTVAFQGKTKKISFVIGFLSGFATSLLIITWGGVTFVLLSIEMAMLAFFFLRSITKENFFAYFGWIFAITIFSGMIPFTAERVNYIIGLLGGTITQVAYLILLLLSIDIFATPKIYKKKELKMPRMIFSLMTALIIGLVFSLLLNPTAMIGYILNLKTQLLHPIGVDRITLTVAENNQPYFGTWEGTFTLKYFWLFIIGAILLFYEAIQKLKKSERYILSAVYAVFLICLVFSRYSSGSILNGTSPTSQLVYFGGFGVFILTFAAIYFGAYKSKEVQKFKEINKESVLVFIMFFIAIISARGAIRLFFLLAPITAILIAFISADLVERALKNKDELWRIVYWGITIIVIFLIVVPSFNSFSRNTINEATYTRPGYYEILWQKAMAWVRNNTPENAVFSHWWDYGYWTQTLGERATFLDGGNAYGYWDYQMGRYVLTGQNEQEALEVLKAHNVSYLLIDPTDIGKYPAYSSIGSDLSYDRYNWIPTFMLDEKQTQETRNEKLLWYQGGTLLDKDFLWYDKNTKQQYLLPAQSEEAIIAGVILPTEEVNISDTVLPVVKQPKAVVVYKRTTRIDIPMCYLYYNNMYSYEDNGPCLKTAIYIMPKIAQGDRGISIMPMGAALFLNERAIKALWVKLYLLNQGENFELVHTEQSPIVEQINQQGANLPEFIHFNDVLGPIKIWKINYPKNVTFRPEYLNTTYPDVKLTIAR